MLQLKDLPDEKVLRKFADRYEGVDSRSVTHFLNILRIGTELAESLDRFLATHGLLQGRWWVLILLMREDDLTSTPSELAEKAGVSRATMSGLINGLLRDGLVARHEDNKDRRSCSIVLTATGQEKLDEVMPDYYPRVKKMMNAIPEQQREDLLKQLMLLKEQSKIFD
ncbi:MAG: MarR family winged helix-turn-helix transcriptional regulator [Methylotenera sp.]|nr:MarR family winged helix-turn-helix transcriptional regulator [Methylotenera sp.]